MIDEPVALEPKKEPVTDRVQRIFVTLVPVERRYNPDVILLLYIGFMFGLFVASKVFHPD